MSTSGIFVLLCPGSSCRETFEAGNTVVLGPALESLQATWRGSGDWLERCLVDSSGRRNTACVTGSEELVQSLGRCSPAKGLSRPAVEGDRHGRKVLGAVHAEVSAP